MWLRKVHASRASRSSPSVPVRVTSTIRRAGLDVLRFHISRTKETEQRKIGERRSHNHVEHEVVLSSRSDSSSCLVKVCMIQPGFTPKEEKLSIEENEIYFRFQISTSKISVASCHAPKDSVIRD